ncbi:MAG: mechanosensitive ion channel domain-containing protein [Verrucomicrobiota bacterium]
MDIPNAIPDAVTPLLPTLVTAIGVGAILWGVNWLLIARHAGLGNERKFPRQILLLGLTFVGLVAVVLSLPVSEGFRNQLVGLIGLLASGILAFSSTTVVANLMAGILLRVTKPFGIGDFIRVGEHFGRVSERGLFDTEVQSESRELIAIPNTYLISNPVTTTRSSGTIVSAALSLGYDVHHSRIEPLLVKAAHDSGLEEPFVHILELRDYSVTYRVSGFLAEVKWLITARSNLFRNVLDVLHGDGIEIMSPGYMSQRRVPEGSRVIPPTVRGEVPEEPVVAEHIVFDKAEQAEHDEREKMQVAKEIEKLEALLKEAPEEGKERIKSRITECSERLKALEREGNRSRPDGDGSDGG